MGFELNVRSGQHLFGGDGRTALTYSLLPGIDQVLSQADAGVGARNGDVSVS